MIYLNENPYILFRILTNILGTIRIQVFKSKIGNHANVKLVDQKSIYIYAAMRVGTIPIKASVILQRNIFLAEDEKTVPK